jgi:hypothetical protein
VAGVFLSRDALGLAPGGRADVRGSLLARGRTRRREARTYEARERTGRGGTRAWLSQGKQDMCCYILRSLGQFFFVKVGLFLVIFVRFRSQYILLYYVLRSLGLGPDVKMRPSLHI